MVVLLGFMKRIHNHWKLRSYIKLETSKAAFTQEITQQMRHQPSVRRGRTNQVPFGVRALESGIEVDGVWISRPNTPASSLPGSPTLSGTTQLAVQPESSKGRPSSSSNMSSVEIAQPLYANPEVSRPVGSTAAARVPLERPARQHKQPPTSDHQPRGRTTYQPRRSSHLRFSNSFDPEDTENLAALEGSPMLTSKQGKQPEGKKCSFLQKPSRSPRSLTMLLAGSDSEIDSRRQSVSWSGSSGKSIREGRGRKPKIEASSPEFSRPECRKSSEGHLHTYELSDLDNVAQDRNTNVNNAPRGRTRSLKHKDAAHNLVDKGPHGTPASFNYSGNDLPGTSQGYSSVKDGFVFHEDDDIANQHTHLMDNNEIDYDQSHAQPLHPFDGNRETRNNQILRKVNSNFQILRSGTLDASRPSNDDSQWQIDLEAANKRSSKKLQKRGRASSKSSYTLER